MSRNGRYFYNPRCHAGFLCVGDTIYADGIAYHITAASEGQDTIDFSTREGQDLVYRKYANVEASYWVAED